MPYLVGLSRAVPAVGPALEGGDVAATTPDWLAQGYARKISTSAQHAFAGLQMMGVVSVPQVN